MTRRFADRTPVDRNRVRQRRMKQRGPCAGPAPRSGGRAARFCAPTLGWGPSGIHFRWGGGMGHSPASSQD